MSQSMVIELVGYLGSALVLVAFLMTSVVKLRVVNSIGSIIFAIYALIIHSYPTAVMNTCLVLINIHYLLKLNNKEKNYELLSVAKEDGFLGYLLEHYKEDIKNCFPEFGFDLSKINRAYIVCCDAVPAGIMLGNEQDGILDVVLDYSIPMYRDCSLGAYLYTMLPKEGIKKASYSGPLENHEDYLKKMGFVKAEEKYIKQFS